MDFISLQKTNRLAGQNHTIVDIRMSTVKTSVQLGEYCSGSKTPTEFFVL